MLSKHQTNNSHIHTTGAPLIAIEDRNVQAAQSAAEQTCPGRELLLQSRHAQ
jgi:hypothetical protein